MDSEAMRHLAATLAERFGTEMPGALAADAAARLQPLAAHRVHRAFAGTPVEPELVRLLCACALAAPSKSDLQQRDIVIVSDAQIRRRIDDLLDTAWIRAAPVLLVVCLNGRRLPQIAQWRGKPFPNDHFDLLFNAIGDAAIALGWLQLAAELAGLGGCPVSEIRNHAEAVSGILDLPERVLPFAGFCLGWPKDPGRITPRLPLSLTIHENRFSEDGAQAQIEAYDRRREQALPYAAQRLPERFGHAGAYGWSEDKARQYSEPLRADFGAFAARRGFVLK